jgi:hypothetical protein
MSSIMPVTGWVGNFGNLAADGIGQAGVGQRNQAEKITGGSNKF